MTSQPCIFLGILLCLLFCQGVLSEACKNMTVKAASGTISSNSPGSRYENNQLCEWIIEAPPGLQIKLVFIDVDIEYGYDSISIWDGNNGERTGVLFNITSNKGGERLFISTLGSLFVRFLTDNDGVFKGFNASYETAVNFSCPTSYSCNPNGGTCVKGSCVCNNGYYGPSCATTQCSGVHLLQEEKGKFQVTFDPTYENGMSCTWVIASPNTPTPAYFNRISTNTTTSLSGSKIVLNFVGKIGVEVLFDQVSIYTGPTTQNNALLGSVTGDFEDELPPPIIAHSGIMVVKFFSDNMKGESGFTAEYSIVDETENLCLNNCSNNGVCFNGSCVCEPNFYGADCSTKDCRGYIFHSDYSRKIELPFTPNLRCFWEIHTERSPQPHVYFQLFKFSVDYQQLTVTPMNSSLSPILELSNSRGSDDLLFKSAVKAFLVTFWSDIILPTESTETSSITYSARYCEGTLTLTNDTGDFGALSFVEGYVPERECTWDIYPAVYIRGIALEFYKLKLREGDTLTIVSSTGNSTERSDATSLKNITIFNKRIQVIFRSGDLSTLIHDNIGWGIRYKSLFTCPESYCPTSSGELLCEICTLVYTNKDVTTAVSVAFTVLACILLGFALCLLGLIAFYRNHAIIVFSSVLFSSLIVVGAIVGYIAIIATVAQIPSNPSACRAFWWLVGLSFTIIYSNLIVKTHRIWKIYHNPGVKLSQLSDSHLFLESLLFVSVEATIMLAWSVADAPEVIQKIVDNSQFTYCSYSKFSIFAGIWVAYKLLLLLLGCVLAFLTRNINVQHRETRTITMITFCWIFAGTILVPMWLILNDDPNSQAIVFCLGFLAALTFTIGVLLVPRFIYIIFQEKTNKNNSNLNTNTSGDKALSSGISS